MGYINDVIDQAKKEDVYTNALSKPDAALMAKARAIYDQAYQHQELITWEEAMARAVKPTLITAFTETQRGIATSLANSIYIAAELFGKKIDYLEAAQKAKELLS